MGTQNLSSSFFFFFLVGRRGSAYHKASRITAFHGYHSIGRSKLGIQTVLCCGVLICWLPTLDLRTLVFLKGFLKFQKMRRDKENKKPGLKFFFFTFPTALIWRRQDQGSEPESCTTAPPTREPPWQQTTEGGKRQFT